MQNLLGILQPYKGVETVYLHNQDVGDIIQGILSTHDIYKTEYDKICKNFDARTNKQIGKNIWQYLKGNVKYIIEPDNKQMLKSPSAILATGHSTGSDCKNYSLFTGGILDALNRKGKRINWCYRFASYRFNDRVPQHVFCVINPDTQNEIWIDAVLPTFNNKKQYFYKVDKKPKQMLVGLSGIDTDLGIGRTKKSAKSVVDSAKKTARKKHFSKVRNQIKKRNRVVLKFAGAPARNSFLLLVKLNVRGLATNLQKLVQKNPEKLKNLWTKGGGNWNALLKEIERGAKKKRLLGIDDNLGVVPVVAGVAAAITAATPLIMKVTTLFKAAGIKGEDLASAAGKIVKSKAKAEVESIDAAAKGEDVETEDEGGEGIEGIGARKKPKAKKEARKAKRAPKKEARKAKRTARKAKKAPKGGFGDEAEIDKIDKATTKKVKGAAIKKAATILKAAAESGLDLADTTSAAVQNVRQAAQSYSEVANEAAAEEKAIEQKEAEQTTGGGIDNKMLLIGGAVAVGALVLLSKKKKR